MTQDNQQCDNPRIYIYIYAQGIRIFDFGFRILNFRILEFVFSVLDFGFQDFGCWKTLSSFFLPNMKKTENWKKPTPAYVSRTWSGWLAWLAGCSWRVAAGWLLLAYDILWVRLEFPIHQEPARGIRQPCLADREFHSIP